LDLPTGRYDLGDICICIDQRWYRRALEALKLILSRSTIQELSKFRIAVRKLIYSEHRRALDGPWNSFLEQSFRITIVKSHLSNHSIPASRLTHDRHIIRVTTEGSNVGFDPLQSEALIEKARVGRWQRLVRHEAKGSKTIADIDCDEVLALADPVTEVVVWSRAVL
jgi:hypothetical protein